MSLSHASLTPDELVRRYVERARADLEPDPLFRRRLRGIVTNQFVAAREGLAQPVARPTQMGKLGRACLYASFALAMSVGGALAASRGAVPGDLLYPMKLEVEAIRIETFPQEFRDDLLVYVLSERTAELGRLVEEGRSEDAAALVETIGARYREVAALGIAAESDELRSSLAVLDVINDRLPARAQAAIERAINRAPGLNGTAPGGRQIPPAEAAGASHDRPGLVPAAGPPMEPSTAAEAGSHGRALGGANGRAADGFRGKGPSAAEQPVSERPGSGNGPEWNAADVLPPTN